MRNSKITIINMKETTRLRLNIARISPWLYPGVDAYDRPIC